MTPDDVTISLLDFSGALGFFHCDNEVMNADKPSRTGIHDVDGSTVVYLQFRAEVAERVLVVAFGIVATG